MKPNKKEAAPEIQSILDSDDEYPDSYYGATIENPAYLNDFRFEEIIMPWLENCKPIQIEKDCRTHKPKNKPASLEESEIEESYKNVEGDDTLKILISQGVLSKCDLFLVQIIAEYCSLSTLIWFIQSLKEKSDKYYKSCLVPDFRNELISKEVTPKNLNSNYYFHLNVK